MTLEFTLPCRIICWLFSYLIVWWGFVFPCLYQFVFSYGDWDSLFLWCPFMVQSHLDDWWGCWSEWRDRVYFPVPSSMIGLVLVERISEGVILWVKVLRKSLRLHPSRPTRWWFYLGQGINFIFLEYRDCRDLWFRFGGECSLFSDQGRWFTFRFRWGCFWRWSVSRLRGLLMGRGCRYCPFGWFIINNYLEKELYKYALYNKLILILIPITLAYSLLHTHSGFLPLSTSNCKFIFFIFTLFGLNLKIH